MRLGRRQLVSVFVAFLGLLLSSCRMNLGDPDNRRLEAMKAEPALTLAAPGTTFVRGFDEPAEKMPFTDRYT